MNKNQIAILGTSTLILVSCAQASTAAIFQKTPEQQEALSYQSSMIVSSNSNKDILDTVIDEIHQKRLLEIQQQKAKIVADNTKKMKNVVNKLKGYIGNTPYVFAGSTPSGWDCSGLVLWAYSHFDIELEHRATKQAEAGKLTKSPKLGDIVVFRYHGSERAYHVGIYLSEDTMLHSGGKKGDVTEITNIKSYGGNYSEISYVTLVETN